MRSPHYKQICLPRPVGPIRDSVEGDCVTATPRSVPRQSVKARRSWPACRRWAPHANSACQPKGTRSGLMHPLLLVLSLRRRPHHGDKSSQFESVGEQVMPGESEHGAQTISQPRPDHADLHDSKTPTTNPAHLRLTGTHKRGETIQINNANIHSGRSSVPGIIVPDGAHWDVAADCAALGAGHGPSAQGGALGRGRTEHFARQHWGACRRGNGDMRRSARPIAFPRAVEALGSTWHSRCDWELERALHCACAACGALCRRLARV